MAGLVEEWLEGLILFPPLKSPSSQGKSRVLLRAPYVLWGKNPEEADKISQSGW